MAITFSIKNGSISLVDEFNKRNIRHWKIPLESVDDLKDCADIICASYKQALNKRFPDVTDL